MATQAEIINNLITNNVSNGSGGGISITFQGTPTIRGNIISDNVAGFGGGLAISGSSPVVVQNLIFNNSAPLGGGGGVSWGGVRYP